MSHNSQPFMPWPQKNGTNLRILMEACATTTLFSGGNFVCVQTLAILIKARLIKASKIDVIHVWGGCWYCKPICFTNDTVCSRTTDAARTRTFSTCFCALINTRNFAIQPENLENLFIFRLIRDVTEKTAAFFMRSASRFDGWRAISVWFTRRTIPLQPNNEFGAHKNWNNGNNCCAGIFIMCVFGHSEAKFSICGVSISNFNGKPSRFFALSSSMSVRHSWD